MLAPPSATAAHADATSFVLDSPVYGPNSVITISLGNLTVSSCNTSLGTTVSDIYIVPQTAVLQDGVNLKDLDPRGQPITVSTSFSGGAIFDEPIGFTYALTPTPGRIDVGSYVVVEDVCRDGTFNAGLDTVGPGFQVSADIPSGDPAAIQRIKASSRDEAALMQGDVALLKDIPLLRRQLAASDAATALKDACIGFDITIVVDCIFAAFEADDILSAQPSDLEEIAPALAVASLSQHYSLLAADPPDPNFQQAVTLTVTPVTVDFSSPITQATSEMGNAAAQTDALTLALLQAFEKYQGAQNAGDPVWALRHAQELKSYAQLLAASLSRQSTAASGLQSALDTSPVDLDAIANGIVALQGSVSASGFTPAETAFLRSVGYTDAQIQQLRTQFSGVQFAWSRAAMDANLQAIASANATFEADLGNFAGTMDPIITTLTAQVSGADPQANPGGPYTGTARAAMTFDGSASTDGGRPPLTFAWDLTGSGQFTDAAGPTPTFTYPAGYRGLAGLRVTNAAGVSNIAYTPVTVADSNQPPAITSSSPAGDVVTPVGVPVAFQATAADPDGDPVAVSWSVDGTTVATGTQFTFNPAASDVGLRTIQALVSDNHAASVAMQWSVAVQGSVGPALTLTKNHAGSFTVGSNGTYTLTVQNVGTSSTTGTITVTDTLPAGLSFVAGTGTGWTCTASGQTVTCTNPGPLAIGDSSSITLTVGVAAPAVPGVTNTATVSTPGDPNAPETASDPTTVNGAPTLTLGESHTGNLTVGADGVYTLTVTNSGSASTTGPITVTDVLPAGLTFVSGSFIAAGRGWACAANGQTVTCTRSEPLSPGAASSITLIVYATAAAVPGVITSASVSTPGDPSAPESTSDPTVVSPTSPTASNTWSPPNPSGSLPDRRGSHVAVWDTADAQMLVFGGSNNNNSNALNDLWAYRPASNTWTQLSPRGSPPSGRYAATAVWDPADGQMLVFGGTAPDGSFPSDLWAYRPASNTWTQLSPGGPQPPGRIYATAVWDTHDGQMLVFGGRSSDASGIVFNDLWAYRPASNSWTELNPPTQPSPRYTQSAVWDSADGQMLIFGGFSGQRYLNELWSYQPASNSWTQLSPGGAMPSPRYASTAAWDPGDGQMLIFGGNTGPADLNDLWAYRPATNAWTQLGTSGPVPSPRYALSAAWDLANARMLVFGGFSSGGNRGVDGYANYNDLWAFQLDATPPVTTARTSPGPNSAGWNNSDVTVTLSSTDSEPGGTGVKTITYSATGAQAIASTTVSGASTSFAVTTEGTTSISFFATDNAGNVETSKTLVVNIDKTPPTITIAGVSNGTTYDNTVSPAVTIQDLNARGTTDGTSLTYAALSGGAHGSLDLGSGAFTQFGNTSVQLVGLGTLAGTLYSDTTGSGTLYKVDPPTGNLTPVGSAGISFEEFGSTTSGLFAIDYEMTLYSIDPATGAATRIGSTGLALPDHNGLSSGSSTLYYTQQFGASTPVVYTLDTSTGAATSIGTTPGVFGPVVINNKLYVESWTPCTINPSGICAQSIYAFDPATGISVSVSSVSTPLQAVSDGLVPVPGTSVTSGVDPAKTTITLDGQPYQSGTPVTTVGPHTLSVTATDIAGNTASATVVFRVKHTTALIYTGPSSGNYGDVVTLAATLTDTSASPPLGVSGLPVTLSLGTQSCTGTTDTTGTVTCSVTLNQTPGSVAVSAGFAGNSTYLPSNTTPPTLFTIGPAVPVCTVTGYTVTYDATAHTATGSCTGVAGATLSGLDLSATAHTKPGSYADTWTFTDPTGGNYASTSGTVTDTITKAAPVCTVTGYTGTYDAKAHSAAGSCTGVAGQTLSGLDLSGTAHTNAGSYADTWTFTDSTGNYTGASGTVTDTVNKATVHVDANPASKTYGDPEPAPSGTLRASDFQGSDTPSSSGITGTPNCSIASHSQNAGTDTGVISCGPGTLSSANYTFAAGTAANLTINQATLTVTADNKSITYGDPPPAFTYQVAGYKNGDTPAILTGSATCAASGTTGSPPGPAGTYPITCTLGTLSAGGNYKFSFTPGTLTISKKPATLGYTGGMFFSTGSSSATSATVTLQATITPTAGGSPDPAKAGPVTFLLYKSTNLAMTSPDATCTATSVSSAGIASCTLSSLGIDNWTVVVQEPGNGYFTAPDSDPVVITVYQPATGEFVTGGGWVTDPSSTVSAQNKHGNFGLTVRYKTGTTTPTGQSVYVFRGTDGYDYVIKSNSWAGGGLSFGTNTASFSGKCNVTAIDPRTGLAVSGIGGGNYTCRVDVTDNGSTGDTYAISVYTSTGTLFHQAGTTSSQLPLGGGNIVVHIR